MNIQYSRITEGYVVETPENFRVNRRVFVDQDVLDREMKSIFERCWLFLGHESELPKAGDFIVRTVGGHNLIFVRGQDDKLRAFFNVCPHRGATVCREDRGNTKLFRCLYHSWAFDTQGKTVVRPEPERYAPGALEAGQFDLPPVPRIEDYRGFYFINFNPAAESLVEYLAGATKYLDRVVDKSEVGLEVIGGTHQYAIAANWKCLCENTYDGYHAGPTHVTFFEYMANAGELQNMSDSLRVDDLVPHVNLGNGHVASPSRGAWGRPVARASSSWSDEAKRDVAELMARLEKRLGKEYASQIANDEFNMVIFPNFAVNDHFSTNIRTMEPDGPGRLRVNSWSIAPKEETKALREVRRKNFLAFLGPGGFASPDDAEALEHCQRGYYNLPDGWNDVSRGLGAKDFALTDEFNQRAFWREWSRRMAEA
ncbi:MAG: Rieske 2Fe-2S domain-containing protein [Hyphomonadaceae bacterium]